MNTNKNIVVLLSGGQDSTTCLYWAKERYDKILAVNIAYGQRHKIEIESARNVAKVADVELFELNFAAFSQFGNSAMIEDRGDVNDVRHDNLPSTFLPGRNIIFGILAAALASHHNIDQLAMGVCQTDFSGYPDCRRATIDAMEKTIRLGLSMHNFRIHTPLMWLTKAQTVKMAREMPGCWEALAKSYTCYNGTQPPCGNCPACKLRIKGFYEAGFKDPAT